MPYLARRLRRGLASLMLAALPVATIAAEPAATPSTETTATPSAAPAATPAAEPADHVGYCIPLHTIKSSKVIDGRTILFELSGNRMLVNRLPHNCPGLRFEKRFLYKTSLNQLCSLDMITVLTDMGRGASCGLGKFEVYVPPETVDGKPDDGKLEPAQE